MSPEDQAIVSRLFDSVGHTGQIDMRKRCIEVVKQFRAMQSNEEVAKELSRIIKKLESLMVG